MKMTEGYLPAAEAAAYLGVSRATLYAYVSRGLIVSEPEQGSASRSRRYPRASLDELKGARERRRDPSLRALGALRSGPPVLDSALTLIRDGRLWYRGRDARELSRTATLEEVACLLWTGTTEAADELFPRSASLSTAGIKNGSIADRIVARLIEARAESPVTMAETSGPALRAAARTITRLYGAAGASGSGTLAERLARGWRAPDAGDINAALILCADHELNTSAFTARCVASTDAPIPNVLLAALCALEGRRHGGVSERAEALLAEAERDGARRAWRRTLSAEGWIPGLHHRLYPEGDPRANEILARIRLAKTEPAAQIIAFARRQLGMHANLEFALAAFARSARLPHGAPFALFALGRSVGWIAHAFEAAAEGRLIRPRARYTGPAPEIASER